jgi:agmatine deiminase
MISDKQTNFVYFSQYLKEKHSEIFNNIAAILNNNGVGYGIINGNNNNDIWARDYMPIQTHQNRFVKFKYEPSYINKKIDFMSDYIKICNELLRESTIVYSDINLDGGNVVKWEDKVMISDRIFTENPQYSDKNQLVNELAELLQSEVIIIPQIICDFTGHADGMVKFLNSKKVIGNHLDLEFKYWKKKMEKLIPEKGLEYVNMPFFEYKEKQYSSSAIGCYVNYLEVGNLIIFPIFEVQDNKDDECLELMAELYPKHSIEPININDIVRKGGGLMNCISWNVLK